MIPPGIPATLTDLEMALMEAVAGIRYAHSRATGARDRTYAKSVEEAMRLEVGGAAGEYVLARYLDRFWNATPTDFVGSVDVGIRTGYPLAGRWDAKWTPRDDGSLLIPAWIEPRVDLAYALVVGEPPNLRIIGSLDGKRCRDCPITTRGRGRGRFIDQDGLIPWGFLA